MQFTTALLAAFAATASARIVGISAPKQVVPGEAFPVTIRTEGYIQSVEDVAIVFGASTPAQAYPGTLGRDLLLQKILGPDLSNVNNNISTRVTLPADFEKGKAVLVGALYSIYGASHSPLVQSFNVTIDVADTANWGEYVDSKGSV
ncbi:uncharacterized protein K452DRAFT_292513 [Aplosporella prunicola CBS 121167]|uniref:Uncharacterized protein n=1 Tax=Aplosporella prunicola CBS 121167 TaxID=1176127 RepID=A0A6A6AXI0_9PEZI|nr:uncharacterized protein K452DRAFT_292513 [Aplosporella prunicola CBS 121167]KAF2136316.1 hypothetical protein K452DRAFT_292513 [Aplosporella prunicola CBS 121167]